VNSDGGDPQPRITPVLFLLAVAAVVLELVGAALWLRWRYSRNEVSGSSMAPALRPGDWIIVDRRAYRGRLPLRGDVVLARDPRDPSRELVKRVGRVDLHGNAWLLGDNEAESTDSRTFGLVPSVAIVGRVRWRYWPGMPALVR
jgi:nickel-type superoxide dismutase maturation protease